MPEPIKTIDPAQIQALDTSKDAGVVAAVPDNTIVAGAGVVTEPVRVIDDVENLLKSANPLITAQGEVAEIVKVEGDATASHAVVGSELDQSQAREAIRQNQTIVDSGSPDDASRWAALTRIFSTAKQVLSGNS